MISQDNSVILISQLGINKDTTAKKNEFKRTKLSDSLSKVIT